MENYGLSKYQIKSAINKVNFNKEFMLNNGVHIDDKIVPFADFVANSYTNADRYIAELQHRAWSVYEYAKEKCLSNVFITLTLPSHWHPKKTFKKRLITNKKFSGRKYIATINKIKFLNCHVTQRIPLVEPLLDFTNTIDKYNPRNASKELSKMLKELFNERSYRSIDKDDRCYFRVTEPHKDGTPHVHMSLFVPADKVQFIVNSVNRLFPAPLSKIETEVKSPVKYLMKYVLKTLDDLREDTSKITNLSLWYLYHGISRFYTSRTFVALEVYRKLNGMYTLRDLTKSYNSEDVNVYIDTTTQKISKIDNQYGTIYTQKPVNWSQKLDDSYRISTRIKFKIITKIKKEKYTFINAKVIQNIPFLIPILDFESGIDKNTVIQLDSGFESIYKDKIQKPIDVIIDGEEFILYHHQLKRLDENQKLSDILIKSKKQPYQMNDLHLYEYYQNLDIETCDLKHYAVTKNVLIDRRIIDEPKINLALYQDDFFKFESEVF